MSQRKEKHTALIDDLERELFPHQESEEEQESFTKQGRQRVDAWIEKVTTTADAERVRAILRSTLKGFQAGERHAAKQSKERSR